jgi:hypothetical protein
MLQLHGMKVMHLTTGDLTDMRMFFFRSMDNNFCEKSAEDILSDVDRPFGEGLNLIQVRSK